MLGKELAYLPWVGVAMRTGQEVQSHIEGDDGDGDGGDVVMMMVVMVVMMMMI